LPIAIFHGDFNHFVAHRDSDTFYADASRILAAGFLCKRWTFVRSFVRPLLLWQNVSYLNGSDKLCSFILNLKTVVWFQVSSF